MRHTYQVLTAIVALLSCSTPALAQAGGGCTAPPGEVRDLMFAADKVTLTWTAPAATGGVDPIYDVLGSAVALDFAAAICVESNGTDTQATDASEPLASGVVRYFLSRAENDCGEGSLGQRAGRHCGACLTDATCNDGSFCSGAEACGPEGDCHAGTPPMCAPYACDEARDACFATCSADAECDAAFACHAGGCLAALDVNSTTDEPDASPDDGACATAAGECTLRAAVQEANARPGAQVIRLREAAFVFGLGAAGEDAAGAGDLDLRDDVVIRGVSAARTWIDAQSLDRIFHVHPGVTATLARLMAQQGHVGGGAAGAESGGCILNEGTLTLDHAAANACEADGMGGGIYNAAGSSLMLDGSTVSYNRSGSSGGGIANHGDLVAVVSTVSTNTAAGRGGGIHQGAGSFASLTNVTVYRNSAAVGGAVDSQQGTMTAVNTILAGSVAGSDCSVPPVSLGHNLASDLSCDLTQPGDLQETDPQLAELLVYLDAGIRTHFPLEGGPLQGAGDEDAIPPLDQNGTNTTEHGTVIGSTVFDDVFTSGRLYVSTSSGIKVYKTLFYSLLTTIPGVYGDRLAVHPDGTRLYALEDDLLTVVNTDTFNVLASIPLPQYATGIALHPSGVRLFVCVDQPAPAMTYDKNYVIDVATNTTVHTIAWLADVNELRDCTVQDTGGLVAQAALGYDFLQGVEWRLAVPSANPPFNEPAWFGYWEHDWRPYRVAAGPLGRIYTADTHFSYDPVGPDSQNRISRQPPSSGADPIPLLTLPGTELPLDDILVHPDGKRIYTSGWDGADDNLYVASISPPQLITTVPGRGGQLAIHPLGYTVYTRLGPNGVSLISTFTNTVALELPAGPGPDGIAVKP